MSWSDAASIEGEEFNFFLTIPPYREAFRILRQRLHVTSLSLSVIRSSEGSLAVAPQSVSFPSDRSTVPVEWTFFLDAFMQSENRQIPTGYSDALIQLGLGSDAR